jgi:hypothetical protein
MMTSLNGHVSGRRVSAHLIFVTTLCLLLSACSDGGSGPTGSGTSGSNGDATISCNGFPKPVPVTVNGTPQTFTQVCVIVRESAPVTPSLGVSTITGNLTGHGRDTLNAFVVYARILAQAADQGTATALAKSVVINTANSGVSATPNQVAAPQALEVDFEVFTAPSTNLTLTGTTGNLSVDNYDAIVQLMTNVGNTSLSTVQGQVTVTTGVGNIADTLSGSSFTGAGMTATTDTGNISVSHPAGFQAAFTAETDLGRASIDGHQQASGGAPQAPAIVTAGSGAPIQLKSKVGNVSVVTQ